MSDKLNGFIVVLEKPMRDDDVDWLQTVLCGLKGVAAVELLVEQPNDAAVEIRERIRFAERLNALAMEVLGG
jgi:hypothetical protein